MATSKRALLLKTREIYQKNIDDLDLQIALNQPMPPVSLLRQREFFEQQLRQVEDDLLETAGVDFSGDAAAFFQGHRGVVADLAARFQTHFARINEERILAFVRQFQRRDWMRYALILLQNVSFFDDPRIGDIFRDFYFRGLSDTARQRAVFTGLGGIKDSAYLINYLCSKALTEVERKPLRFNEIKDAIRSSQPDDTTLIFLDDNVGSGKQALQIFREWLDVADGEHHYVDALTSEEALWLRRSKLLYFCVIGFEEGMRDLAKELAQLNLNLEIVPGLRLREDQGCFGAATSPFVDRDERRIACEMAREIGFELLADKKWSAALRNERALGYGNSQKLIVFAYNTPTCTLPILWKAGMYKGLEWNPLFPRRA